MRLELGLASAGETGTLSSCFIPLVKYATASTWELSRLLPTTESTAYIVDTAQHPVEPQVVVAASTDCKICVLDLVKSSLIHAYAEHTGRIWQLCFCNTVDDLDLVHIFFSAAEDGAIKVWDTRTTTSVSTISITSVLTPVDAKEPLYCVDCNGKLLVSGATKICQAWQG